MSWDNLGGANWRNPWLTGGIGWKILNGQGASGTSATKAPKKGGAGQGLSQYNTRSDWWNDDRGVRSEAGDGHTNRVVRGSGQKEMGWMNTLQQSTGSNKGQTGTPTFSEEVYSTQETRAKAPGAGTWLTSFQALPQHSDTPMLDPGFAQMFGEVEKLKGAVRRSTSRLL
jgi:hypothetical protein